MKNISFLIATYCFFVFTPLKSTAQNLESDSIALLALYSNTGGINWTNQQNWLSSEPLESWYGITVMNNRVTKVELPANNLSGIVPSGFDHLNVLNELDLSHNMLTGIAALGSMTNLNILRLNNNLLSSLPQTESSVLFDLSCENNRLDFGDLEPFDGLVVGNFQYSPQAHIGEEHFRYYLENDDVTLSVEVAGSANLYAWFKDGQAINPSPQTIPTLDIFDANESDEGEYIVEITNNQFPALTLYSEPIHLRQFLRDNLGGAYVPNQLIVEFTNDATQFERDTMLAYYDAERLEICMCGVLELWLLPDTSITPQGDIIIGIEGVKEDAVSKAKVEEADKNYLMKLLDQDGASLIAQSESESIGQPIPLAVAMDEIIPVAVIDVGIDTTISTIFPWLWTNEEELFDNMDNDANCLVDDNRGYNFVDDNRAPMDAENGHGTHLAGIIINGAPLEIQLMNIQTHDDSGQGLLFEATCAIYYAFQQGAKVINLSWGYRGEPVAVLENAIARAGESCQAIVITSAGNDGDNNDLLPHYPSSYTLDNIIAVAALNSEENDLLEESNFGPVSVDIAAPGDSILSNLPNPQGFGFKSGTSMAAAAVSRGAALLFLENPEATYLNVIDALVSTAEPLATLDNISSGGKMDLDAALTYIQNVNPDNSCEIMVSNEPEIGEKEFHLKVFPQPFYDNLTIEITASNSQKTELMIFDAIGRAIFSKSIHLTPGVNQINWDAKTSGGNTIRAGIYFACIRLDKQMVSFRLLKMDY